MATFSLAPHSWKNCSKVHEANKPEIQPVCELIYQALAVSLGISRYLGGEDNLMSVSALYGEGLPERAVGDNPPSDRTLVHYIREGDDTAAELLYHRYATRLRKIIAHRCSPEFASRFDADDVVQSVFRLFYEGVRSRYYEVPKDGELWGLLFVLAVNKVKDQSAHHRAAKRSVYRTTTVAADNTETGISQDDQTATLLRLVVEEYLNQLPEQERTIVGLRMTGHSVAEIAEKTGRALRTIERILQKSRDRLQELLNSN